MNLQLTVALLQEGVTLFPYSTNGGFTLNKP